MLAAKVILDLGVELVAFNFNTGFYKRSAGGASETEPIKRAAAEIDLPLQIIDISEQYLNLLVRPEFGFGRNLNPCIDCKIMMLRSAKEKMGEVGAQFIVTGEVLGQRPMSQHRSTLNLIEKQSGLRGVLLRPLSAKLLKPTLAEEKGWIEREALYDFSGRTRKPQIQLAERLGISYYAQPAGGCYLTDENYTRRFKDILRHTRGDRITTEEIELALHGRHFRLSEKTKVVVGRDERDNKHLESFIAGRWMLRAVEFEGPLTLVEGDASDAEIELAARLTARYCDGKHRPAVKILASKGDEERIYQVQPMESKEVSRLRI